MITSRLPGVGTTIFTVMSQLAAEHQAVNLGQGFPDFEPDVRLRELVAQAMQAGHNQYPYMAGVASLREAISEKVVREYGRRYDPATEITVTSGATEALMAAVMACAQAGDEVIVIEPCYDLYRPAIQLAGARPVSVGMRAPTEGDPYYRVDWDQVCDAITSRTRVIMVNSPHNPTGTVFTEDDLIALETIVHNTGIVIISDEAYEHIVFDGERHLSLASRPALASRTFVVASFGKTYHITGWKIGYVCAPPALSAELRKIHQFLVFTVSAPMQVALAGYMQDVSTYSGLSAFYQSKRDALSKALLSTALKPLPSAGSFFLLVDYGAVSDAPELAYARQLTTEFGVTAIPVAAFYEDPDAESSNHRLLRLCFAKRQETLDAAVERLRRVPRQ